MAAKANTEVTNQTISSLAMAAKANREVTIMKTSVLWQWQPKTIQKSL